MREEPPPAAPPPRRCDNCGEAMTLHRRSRERAPEERFEPGPEAGMAEIRESHVSTLIFLGDRVYKLKKPVRTGFLDFTTRQAREAACRREVELNRRLAPDVYLGVLDVLGPDGHACDHLVAMHRLPENRRLAHLARGGDLHPAQVAELARVIARFHSRCER